jgi:hypothetical protein
MLLGAVCVQFHGSITHGVVGTVGDGPGAAPKRRHVHAVYANMLDDLERAKFPPFEIPAIRNSLRKPIYGSVLVPVS